VTVLQDRAGAPAQASAGAVPEGTGPPAAIPAEIFAAAAQAYLAGRMLAGQLLGKAALAGPELIGAVVAGALRAIERDWPLHRFLDTDTDTALRILTGSRSVAGRGLTTALECLIDAERDRGAFRPELDSATLAYAIMRICEGFLYADVIADRPPDTARAVTVIRALLAGLDRAAG
jgi:hypothetical protein